MIYKKNLPRKLPRVSATRIDTRSVTASEAEGCGFDAAQHPNDANSVPLTKLDGLVQRLENCAFRGGILNLARRILAPRKRKDSDAPEPQPFQVPERVLLGFHHRVLPVKYTTGKAFAIERPEKIELIKADFSEPLPVEIELSVKQREHIRFFQRPRMLRGRSQSIYRSRVPKGKDEQSAESFHPIPCTR